MSLSSVIWRRLSLALIGVAGVIGYSVTRRTRDFGIQMALGASRTRILWSVLGQGLKLTVSGLIIGFALSAVAVRSMQSLLFGIQSVDAAVFTLVPLILAVVAAIATYVPARRAIRIQPSSALRYE